MRSHAIVDRQLVPSCHLLQCVHLYAGLEYPEITGGFTTVIEVLEFIPAGTVQREAAIYFDQIDLRTGFDFRPGLRKFHQTAPDLTEFFTSGQGNGGIESSTVNGARAHDRFFHEDPSRPNRFVRRDQGELASPHPPLCDEYAPAVGMCNRKGCLLRQNRLLSCYELRGSTQGLPRGAQRDARRPGEEGALSGRAFQGSGRSRQEPRPMGFVFK